MVLIDVPDAGKWADGVGHVVGAVRKRYAARGEDLRGGAGFWRWGAGSKGDRRGVKRATALEPCVNNTQHAGKTCGAGWILGGGERVSGGGKIERSVEACDSGTSHAAARTEQHSLSMC
eukprot:7138-Chlamydomonas_euryale.AAC.1